MGLLLALGYAVSSMFGIGILVLPYLFQLLGVLPSLVLLTFISLLLNLATYAILELIEISSDDVVASVAQHSGQRELTLALFGMFVYSALTAYVVASGDQLAAFFGGDPHYWSAVFFALAFLLAIRGLSRISVIATYISLFLVTTVLFMIPVNLNYDSLLIPWSGHLSLSPLFLAVAAFALSVHFTIYDIHRLLRDEKSNIVVLFAAFAFAFLVYAAFGLTTAAVAPLSQLSTVSLVTAYPPFYALLITVIALAAFYTSFISLSNSFISAFRDYIHHRTIYALLMVPVALLYLLVRQLSLLDLVALVGRLGGASLLLFLALAMHAHFRASGQWKLSFPPVLSRILSLAFLVLGVAALL